MIPLGGDYHGPAFGHAAARVAGSVSRLVGIAFVLLGFYGLYAWHTAPLLGDSYSLSLYVVAVEFTPSTVGGTRVGIATQLLLFAAVTFAIGASVVLEATRQKTGMV